MRKILLPLILTLSLILPASVWSGFFIGNNLPYPLPGTLGSANQVLGVNPAGGALQYKTISGTTNRVTATFDASGHLTLSSPQDTHTGASPTFVGETLSGLAGSRVLISTSGKSISENAALTSGRVPFADGTGSLTDDADMTFATDTLTVTKVVGATDVSGATLHSSSLTSGRVPIVGAAGLITDDSDLTFSGSTLTVTDVSAGSLYVTGTITDASLTASRLVASNSDKQLVSNAALTSARVPFADGTGSLTDDSDMTFSGSTLTVTDVSAGSLYVTGTVTDASLTASLPIFTNVAKQFVSNTITGTGSVVMSTSPSIVDQSINNATVNELTVSLPVFTDGSKKLASNTMTGTGSVVMSASPTIVDASMNTATLNALTASLPVFTDGSKILVSNTITGTGKVVMDTSPTIVGATLSGTISAEDVSANSLYVTGTIKGASLNASVPIETDGSKYLVSGTKTGTGSEYVMSASPTLTGSSVIADASAASLYVTGQTRLIGDVSSNVTLSNAGTDTNSFKMSMVANSGGTSETGSLQVLYGADPYLRVSAPDNAGAETAIVDIHDTIIAFTSDNAVDIGASGANRPKNIYASGTITGVNIVGTTDVSGNTIHSISLTASMPVETDETKTLVSGTKTGTGSIYVMQQSASLLDPSTNTVTINAAANASRVALIGASKEITSGTNTDTQISATVTKVTDASANWDAAYTHKTTEDAISGLVKVDGAGNYSAVTDNSANWDAGYTYRVTGATATLPLKAALTSNVIDASMTQSATDASGWLSGTDWNTFNNKQDTLSFTGTGNTVREASATLYGVTLSGVTQTGALSASGNVSTTGNVSGASGNITNMLQVGSVNASDASATTMFGQAYSGTEKVVRDTSPTITNAQLVNPALGTPASGVATNLTGTASGLTAGTVTTNANLTGPVTSAGNATSLNLAAYDVSPNTLWGSGYTGSGAIVRSGGDIGAATGTSVSVSGEASANRFRSITQPAFMAVLDTTVSNVTGDDTVYTVIFDNELVDQSANFNISTGIFTAPVTGLYQLNTSVGANELDASHGYLIVSIVTTQKTYKHYTAQIFGAANLRTGTVSILAPMTAGDTAKVTVAAGTAAIKTVDVAGHATTPGTSFSGYLAF